MNIAESRTEAISSSESSLFGILLLFAISLPLTGVNTALSYGFVLVAYVVLFTFAVRHISNIVISRVYVILICLLSGSLILSGVVSSSIDSVLRIGAFFTFTLANLLVLPSVIPFRHLTFLASRYAAGLIVLGFLPYLGIQSLFGLFDLSLWGGYLYLYPEISPIRSIFANPNSLGFVLLVGAIAALIEAITTRRRIAVALVFFNTIGLLFTNYRTGMVAFAIVLSLCSVYALFNQQTYTVVVVGGLTTSMILLLAMFGLVPGPAWLTDLSLNGRRVLWQEAVTAIRQAPLLGIGFGNYTGQPHNSFLRMVVTLGIGGGFVYVLIFFRAILQSIREATDWPMLGISLYLVAFFFIQLMNGLTFIGISFISGIISLLIGYHIRNDSLSTAETKTQNAKV